jgi:hypothetical protein
VTFKTCEVLPKPATRCPPLGAPPPTPPAVRSQAEVAIALPSSLLSPPAPLWAFLALYPEPAAGSGCASISSAHDPSAAICEFSSDSIWVRWDMPTLIRKEVAQRHLLHLLLGSCSRKVSVPCQRARCASIAPSSHNHCLNPNPHSVYSRSVCTYPYLRSESSRAVRAWL